MLRMLPILATSVALYVSGAAAQEVRITEDLVDLTVQVNGLSVTIARGQDPAAMLSGEFAQTARACPPHCIVAQSAAAGVATVAELELLDFVQNKVAAGQGALIDARLPDQAAAGTIPAAVNIPFVTLAPENPYRKDLFLALGAKDQGDGVFDFSGALEVMVFCNGAWSDQSGKAIRALIEAGYPPEKLFFYRGGMQDWRVLGFSVSTSGGQG